MMKCKFSEKQLWAFVSRIDSHEKVQIAIDFLTNLDGLSIDLYDDLMIAISQISRELYNPRWH